MIRKSRRILVFTAIPSLAALAAATWFFLVLPQRAAAVRPGNRVAIVEVERLTTNESIEISGNIEPVKSADLAFPIAGYIEAVYVHEGDYVAIGDVVAVLEDSQYRYNLAEVDVEIDTENITGTKRNLDLLSLKREMQVSALEDTRLKSTIEGLVTSVAAEAGDYVTAQQAGSEVDVVVRVVDRSTMTATVEVDELDAPLLFEGLSVEFQFDAYPDLDIVGTVSSIPLEARETSQGIAVLDTEVSIENPPAEILPFFTFSGEIFLDDSEEILLISEQAVLSRGNRTFVMVAATPEEAEAARAERTGITGETALPMRSSGNSDGITAPPSLPDGLTAIPVSVSVKAYGGGKVQVLAGLDPGDRVVVMQETASTGDSGSDTGDGEKGTSVMDLLGLPSGPGPGAGGGPPPGGDRP